MNFSHLTSKDACVLAELTETKQGRTLEEQSASGTYRWEAPQHSCLLSFVLILLKTVVLSGREYIYMGIIACIKVVHLKRSLQCMQSRVKWLCMFLNRHMPVYQLPSYSKQIIPFVVKHPRKESAHG